MGGLLLFWSIYKLLGFGWKEIREELNRCLEIQQQEKPIERKITTKKYFKMGQICDKSLVRKTD